MLDYKSLFICFGACKVKGKRYIVMVKVKILRLAYLTRVPAD